MKYLRDEFLQLPRVNVKIPILGGWLGTCLDNQLF